MAASLTFAVPVEWNIQSTYEINMIVFVGKKAYTAIQNVPTGIQITNTEYWSETGVPYVDLNDIRTHLNNLDSDVDNLEDDVSGLDSRVSTNSTNIATLTSDLATAVSALNTATQTLNNIMVSLYTPYPTQNQGGN